MKRKLGLTLLAIPFAVCLLQPWHGYAADEAEEINVDYQLAQRLKKSKNVSNRELKTYLGDSSMVLQSVEFLGTGEAYPISFALPNGASIVGGRLSVDESLLKAPEALAEDDMTNRNSSPMTMHMTLSKTETSSESFTNSTTLKTSTAVTGGVSVLIVSASATETFELSNTTEYTKGSSEDLTFEHTIDVDVPPKSIISARIMGQKLDLDIPYTIDVELSGNTRANFVSVPPAVNDMWGVTLYKDESYKEDSDFWGLKSGQNSVKINELGTMQDKVSSFKLTGDVKVKFYKNKNCEGDSKVFTANTSSLDKDWDNKFSSLEITALKTPPAPQGVMVYYDKDYKDRKKFYPVSGGSKRYNIGDGNFNDKVTSVELYGDTIATVYEHINGDGKMLEVKNNIPELKKAKFNDILSSLDVMFNDEAKTVNFQLEGELSKPDRIFTINGMWEGTTVNKASLEVDETRPIAGSVAGLKTGAPMIGAGGKSSGGGKVGVKETLPLIPKVTKTKGKKKK